MVLLRLIRKNVLKADDTCGEQSASGWSALNTEMSHVASYHYWVLPDDCWIANRVQYHLYGT